ncbi:MAG: treF [Caulobacter sp.]|nr:treF [Caulobacter sp.]
MTGPRSPAETFAELFERVALAGLCEDGKTWADAEPLRSPGAILRAYRAAPPVTDAGLRAFVAANFRIDASPLETTSTAGLCVARAIEALWPALTRTAPAAPRYSSLLPLPHPYLAPGGRFTETYYWDSYFALLGLDDPQAAREMADNFAHLIRAHGHVPNGNRTYYLGRSQPPVFFLTAGLTEPRDPAAAYARYLPELVAEYRWWMRGATQARQGAPVRRVVRMPGGALLNRYWDDKDTPRDESFRADVRLAKASPQPEREIWRNLRAGAESGWDFTSRWLADGQSLELIRTTDIVPIDLNCILHGLEGAIADGAERAGDASGAARYRRKAAARKAAIVRHLWNEPTGLFDDFDWTAARLRGAVTAAAVYPLFFAIADAGQAARTAQVVARELLAPGGLLATNRVTGQQWDAPNGWAPLQWLAVRGLEAYGHNALAGEIAGRWSALVSDVYARTGRFLEKYDVVTLGAGGGGEYPIQDGFGWTNGVTARFLAGQPS